MKRLFLSTICTLALLAFAGQSLSAQQETTPSSQNNVIIIQKTQNDDGTWSVKKKSVQKGQSADAYLQEIDMENPVETVSEITIMTGDEAKEANPNAETILMIRKGNNRTEIKWDDTDGPSTFTMPNMSDLALIGDEIGEPKAFLGIYPETHDGGGVLVTDIVPGSGAAAAGLKSGDVITIIDGATLASEGDLGKTLASHKPGDVINVTFLRGGQSIMTTSAVLTGKKQPNINYNYNYSYNYKSERNPCEVFIGVMNGNWGNGEKGVGVSGIIPGWPAEEAGLQLNDRIISMDGVPVNTHNELVVQRDKHKAGERFTLGILREGNEIKVKARFKECPGQETPSEVVEVPVIEQPTLPQIGNTLQLEELNAYPNPTYGDLNITFRGEAVPTTVTITDIMGKVVFNESLASFDGNYNRQVDVSKGAAGTLLITIRQQGKVLTTPVVLLNRA